jgi:hypothetical protein
MNKHFTDARYYLRRAGEHLAAGLREELAPVEAKLRALTGREPDPEPSRVESIREDLVDLERRAEGEARAAIADARERIATGRGQQSEA